MGEDIEPTIIHTMLAAAMQRVPVSEKSSGVLVIRDGRVPESEDIEAYRRGFDGPVTLVELRKRGNPPLLLGEECHLPNHPTVAWFPEAVGGSLGFLVTLPQSAKNEFDTVMKIWMRDKWDGMGAWPRATRTHPCCPNPHAGARSQPTPPTSTDILGRRHRGSLR